MDSLKYVVGKSLVTLTIVRFNEKLLEVNVLVDDTQPLAALKDNLAGVIEDHHHQLMANDINDDKESEKNRILSIQNFLKTLGKAESLNDLNIKEELDDGYCEEEETDNISFIEIEEKSIFAV